MAEGARVFGGLILPGAVGQTELHRHHRLPVGTRTASAPARSSPAVIGDGAVIGADELAPAPESGATHIPSSTPLLVRRVTSGGHARCGCLQRQLPQPRNTDSAHSYSSRASAYGSRARVPAGGVPCTCGQPCRVPAGGGARLRQSCRVALRAVVPLGRHRWAATAPRSAGPRHHPAHTHAGQPGSTGSASRRTSKPTDQQTGGQQTGGPTGRRNGIQSRSIPMEPSARHPPPGTRPLNNTNRAARCRCPACGSSSAASRSSTSIPASADPISRCGSPTVAAVRRPR